MKPVRRLLWAFPLLLLLAAVLRAVAHEWHMMIVDLGGAAMEAQLVALLTRRPRP